MVTRPVVSPVVRSVVRSVVGFDLDVALTLNLTNTADLVSWQAKYAPSDPYTRASDMIVADFEGLYKTAGTDVPAFYGAREVTNKLPYSDDISSGWTYLGDRISVGAKDSEGFNLITFITTTGTLRRTLYGTYDTGTGSFGTTNFTLSAISKIYSFTATSFIGIEVTVRVEMKSGTTDKVTLYFYETGGAIIFYFTDTNETGTFYVKEPQVEIVNDQTNQNPSNYIATTTAAAVTEYLTTENGNTVTDSVVTEAAGAELENVIGLAFWPSTTNVIPADEYRDFSHVNWVKTNGSITAGDVTLIDGTVVVDKNTFTASAANATIIKTAYTSASGVHAGGIHAKRKSGSNVIEVTIDGGTTWVDVTTQVDSHVGWALPQTTLPTVTNPQVGLRLVGSGDAVYLDWAQLDDGYARVSVHPIPGAETLAAQVCLAVDAANASKLISDTQGYAYAEAMLLPDDLGIDNGRVFSASVSRMLYTQLNGDNRSYDGLHLLILAGGFSTYSKTTVYWGHIVDTKQVTSNGISSATNSYVGTWNITPGLYIGQQNGAKSWNGIISKLIFGKGIKTTQADMEEITTPGYYCPIGCVFVRDEDGEIITDDGEAVWTSR